MPTLWLANVRLLELRLTLEVVPVPVPDRLTDWGLPPALSVNVIVALRVPAALGVKVTFTVQLLPAVKVEPQLLVWEKSPGLVPANAIPEMLIVELPELLNTTLLAALAVPTD